MTNKVTRQASKWANYVAEKSKFSKRKTNKKIDWTTLILIFSCIKYKPL